ncbi:hypothetical protein [Streptomyces sp. NPDC047123]|uniref:hypothetical protein n=1 Tax=Streptomyces sp. NPDC047123 TaxID=3155622 RepID=UPI0034088911
MPDARPEPTIRLTVDGVSTTYLLTAPATRPGTRRAASGPVYDPCVHLAFVLAGRGHRASRLAAHLGLPRAVARQVVARARPVPAPRPLADRAFGITY